MSSVHFTDVRNMALFCEQSLDPKTIDAMIRENKDVGLSDPALEDNLKTGNYRAVLVALWSERDRTRRLNWLESKADELHPVLMLELAIAKFGASPTIETINSFSIPLMKAAYFRIIQDAQCSKEPSVKHGDAATRMSMTYERRLNGRIKALLNTSLEETVAENRELRIAAIKAKVMETAQLSLSKDLPSPNWIGWHGLAVFINGIPDMYSADEYKQIRDAYANEALASLR